MFTKYIYWINLFDKSLQIRRDRMNLCLTLEKGNLSESVFRKNINLFTFAPDVNGFVSSDI